MGMNHFGEIAYLSKIARPDVAVIVNIGTMHIEHLGSVEGILQAKLEILEGLQQGGAVLLNGDDSLLWNVRDTVQNVSYFGKHNTACNVLGSQICESEGLIEFTALAEGKEMAIRLPLEGGHYVTDALAAVAAGLKLGVAPVKIESSLSAFQNMEGRQEIYRHGDYTIINDSYNAGPESMAAALSVLNGRKGRRIAVLGEMLELGVSTPAEHYKVGRIAAEKADMLFAIGPNSDRTVAGAIVGGMPHVHAAAYQDREKLISDLKLKTLPGDVLLFKGSRGMRMELILQAFLEKDK